MATKKGTEMPPSITEWMKNINYPRVEQFRREDNTKRDRLETLHRMFGLPYLHAEKANGQALKGSDIIKKIIAVMGHKICLFKLLPINPKKPKIRIRGKSVEESFRWLLDQKINFSKYKIEIIPCERAKFSAVFCVDESKVWGEIAEGSIWNFSKGSHKKPSIIFSYDFKKWKFSSYVPAAAAFIKKSLSYLQIADPKLERKMKAKMKLDINKFKYLSGYFECEQRAEGIMFVDYNRILYKMLKKSRISISDKADYLKGICVGPGKTEGAIRIINNPRRDKFNKGDVLVCHSADFNYLPIIKKAAGIITEKNAILSHMTIVCRELNKPFMTRVSNATRQLKNGDRIYMDADNGLVYAKK